MKGSLGERSKAKRLNAHAGGKIPRNDCPKIAEIEYLKASKENCQKTVPMINLKRR
jgi:hypothetical protein